MKRLKEICSNSSTWIGVAIALGINFLFSIIFVPWLHLWAFILAIGVAIISIYTAIKTYTYCKKGKVLLSISFLMSFSCSLILIWMLMRIFLK